MHSRTKLSYITFFIFLIPADLYVFYTRVHISTKGNLWPVSSSATGYDTQYDARIPRSTPQEQPGAIINFPETSLWISSLLWGSWKQIVICFMRRDMCCISEVDRDIWCREPMEPPMWSFHLFAIKLRFFVVRVYELPPNYGHTFPMWKSLVILYIIYLSVSRVTEWFYLLNGWHLPCSFDKVCFCRFSAWPQAGIQLSTALALPQYYMRIKR